MDQDALSAFQQEQIMQGPKTHEQQLRTLEKKPDVPDSRQINQAREPSGDSSHRPPRPAARASELPVSRRGMHQESEHNKHNDAGQQGHKPQQHTRSEEKQK
jgi:hypothetical protein